MQDILVYFNEGFQNTPETPAGQEPQLSPLDKLYASLPEHKLQMAAHKAISAYIAHAAKMLKDDPVREWSLQANGVGFTTASGRQVSLTLQEDTAAGGLEPSESTPVIGSTRSATM